MVRISINETLAHVYFSDFAAAWPGLCIASIAAHAYYSLTVWSTREQNGTSVMHLTMTLLYVHVPS